MKKVTMKGYRRELILIGFACVALIGFALKVAFSRGPSRQDVAMLVDQAILRGDGDAVFPYIWEEEREANNWTPASVNALLKEITISKVDIDQLMIKNPKMSDLSYQTIINRDLETKSGNISPWNLNVTERGNFSRFSLSSVLLESLNQGLDVSPSDFPRVYPGYLARKLRESQSKLQELGGKYVAVLNFEDGRIDTVELNRYIDLLEARSKRLISP
jgi:hypothetical protein